MKSEQSIRLKYAKGLKSGLRFNTVFNDLIGLRIKVQEYHDSYPDYFRVVDMRNGKKNYVCKRLERQELAVIETGQDDNTVNLIFSRINSTGRKISSQDLRQSSATGEFADVVRRIASDVRMDNTYSDHVCLSDIKQISVGDKKLGYDIDLNSTFWRRHDILINTAVIESGDEEVIETLIASKFIPGFKKTKDSLDDLYQQGTKRYKVIEECIKSYDKYRLEESFKKVFDIIDMIFDSVNSNFSEYLFKVKRTRNKDKCFGVLFLAIERLLSDGYFVEDYEAIVCGQHCITGIEEEAKKMFGSIDNYIREVRKKISAQKITDELKNYVLEHFETVNFYGRTLLVFRVKSAPGSRYEDEKFIRHGNESKNVKGNMNSMSLF